MSTARRDCWRFRAASRKCSSVVSTPRPRNPARPALIPSPRFFLPLPAIPFLILPHVVHQSDNSLLRHASLLEPFGRLLALPQFVRGILPHLPFKALLPQRRENTANLFL